MPSRRSACHPLFQRRHAPRITGMPTAEPRLPRALGSALTAARLGSWADPLPPTSVADGGIDRTRIRRRLLEQLVLRAVALHLFRFGDPHEAYRKFWLPPSSAPGAVPA